MPGPAKPKNSSRAPAKPNNPSRTQPLLFVQYDALKPRSKRGEITSHLRRAYRLWQQGIDTGRAPNEGTVQSWSSRSNKKFSPEDCICGDEELAITPLQILQNGQSDPFCSFPLHLDSFVNELINFENTYLRPAISSARIERLSGRQIAHWDDAKSPAENQTSIYAYLSRAAALLSTATAHPKYARMSLVYKGRSLRLLQDQIASAMVTKVDDIAENVMALQKAEMFSHNPAGTLLHTKFLAAFLQQQRKSSGVDATLFLSAVHTDLQSSAMSLTRPFFDIGPDGWVTEEWRKLGGPTMSATFSKLGLVDYELDQSIDRAELEDIFVEVRELNAASLTLASSTEPELRTYLTFQLPVGVLICTARFVNFYLDHCDDSGQLKQSLSHQDYAQVSACLAGLHWTRTAAKFDSMPVGSSTFYAAGPLILSRLREALTLGDGLESHNGEAESRLRFWILFVGAFSEQARTERARRESAEERGWFTTEFAKQAFTMRIFSWQQAREILSGFLYTDALKPHGSTWFWKIFDRVSE